MKRTLECVDCHVVITGDVNQAIGLMKQHVKTAHNRDLVFDDERYQRERWTRNETLENALLLTPELILSA